MLLVIGTLRLPPENLSVARPAMRAMVQNSRAEDGCLEYGYAEDVLEPGLLHVKELWRDQVALDRHFESAHIVDWRASWQILQITDRRLLVYEVSAPRQT